MNIFYLDRCPRKAARMHCDKHVVKMILEYAQLLSTAHHVLDGPNGPIVDKLYKVTHKNHPSAVWVRQSLLHYWYVYDMFKTLCYLYTEIYGKEHLTQTKLLHVLKYHPDNIELKQFQHPPQCMPEEFYDLDTVTAYQQYYRVGKADILKYKSRNPPHFLQENLCVN
jgi:hypothetical protein